LLNQIDIGMTKNKKNYLLFMVGEFTDNDNNEVTITDLINSLTILLGGDKLRYIHHDNLMICHFQSIDTLDELDFILNCSLDESIFAYFLMNKPRNLRIKLDDTLKEHLMNLKSKNKKDSSKNKNTSDNFKNIGEILSSFFDKELNSENIKYPFEEPHFSLLSEDYPKKNIEHNVDDILDKISDKGIESITEEEKKFLDDQSKKR